MSVFNQVVVSQHIPIPALRNTLVVPCGIAKDHHTALRLPSVFYSGTLRHPVLTYCGGTRGLSISRFVFVVHPGVSRN